MENYTNFYLEGLDKTKEAVVNAVIHEGEMRQTEKIVEMIEGKITQAYAEDNRVMIDFLESLILEIENLK